MRKRNKKSRRRRQHGSQARGHMRDSDISHRATRRSQDDGGVDLGHRQPADLLMEVGEATISVRSMPARPR